MRLTDLMLLPLAALWQQKGRTVLTTMGVVFGAFVLAASLSINHGIQETISRESNRSDALRRINVHVSWDTRGEPLDDSEIVVEGSMSEEKRGRIRKALASERTRGSKAVVYLSADILQKLAAIEHVQRVEPTVGMWEFVTVNGQTNSVSTGSASPHSAGLANRIVAGRFFQTPDEPVAVISEVLLYRCGIQDDKAVDALLGQKLKIEIRPRQVSEKESLKIYLSRPNGGETTPLEAEFIANLNRRLPEFLKQIELTTAEAEILKKFMESHTVEAVQEEPICREFAIVGVLRQLSDQELNERNWWDDQGNDSNVLLPCQTAAEFYFSSPTGRRSGVNHVLLIADDEAHVKNIVKQVKGIGLQAHAPIEFIERERLTWRLVFGGMTCVAAVALLVAALGITNTMLMSVLERTREIGIMKSVGASGTHIQAIFLIEGILIGAVGGVIGITLALVSSIPADAWVRGMVERDMNVKLKQALFVFPSWLVITVILFAVIVTTIAALYPARRAAQIDPVIALRHE